MQEPVAILNGAWLPISQARLHVFDLGLVGGVAVTEMVRTFQHQPFRLSDHLERWAESCRAVHFELPRPLSEVQALAEELVQRNSAELPKHEDLGMILFSTAGLNPTYVGKLAAREHGHTWCLHTFPLHWELWRDKITQGTALAVPAIRNIPPDVIDPRIKHRSRLHWWLADQEAKNIDPLASALVLDQHDYLAETAAGNVCVVRNGIVRSPKPGSALEGVSLKVVQELCDQLSIPFQRGDLTVEHALTAEECFLTSTPCCLLPVTTLNRQTVGSGQPGPITRRIMEAWSQLVGVDITAQMQPRQ